MKRSQAIVFYALLILIIFSFFWRISLLTSPGHKGDFSTSVYWLQSLNSPLREFYATTGSNYGPLYGYFLKPQRLPIDFLINRGVDSTNAYWAIFHATMIAFDLLLTLTIFFLVKKYKDKNWGIAAAALYAVNPILYFASGQWGQADNAVLLSILAIFYFMWNKQFIWVLPIATLSILFKPTAAVLLPFIVLIMIFAKQYKAILYGTLISIAVTVVSSLPYFGLTLKIPEFYYQTIVKNDITPRLAVGAKNFWYLFGENKSDLIKIKYFSLTAKNIGFALFFIVSFLSVWFTRKLKDRFLALSLGFFVVSFAFYFLPTRSHERYQLFSFLPLILLMVNRNTRLWAAILYIVSSITFALVVLGMYTDNALFLHLQMQGNAIAIANGAIMIAGVVMLWYYGSDRT